MAGLAPGARAILALAGPPGAGKSTLSERMIAALPPGTAEILPMDGYHFDDEILVPRGDRPRKGAPHTYDLGGFRSMLRRLRANEEGDIAVPRFDRDLEIARGAARIVPASARLIIAEGNYLALDRPGWRELAELYDRTAFIDVSEAELTRRLTERWQGYGMDAETVRDKLEENDLPNGRLVISCRRPVDWIVSETD